MYGDPLLLGLVFVLVCDVVLDPLVAVIVYVWSVFVVLLLLVVVTMSVFV